MQALRVDGIHGAIAKLFTLSGLPPIMGGVDTTVATGDAETQKLWAKRLWIEMPRVIYFGRFMKENDMNAIIEVQRALEGVPGDRLTFTLMRKLTGSGRTDDATMEGFEEAMTPYSDDITLSQTRNAIRLAGRLSERRTAWSQRDTAKQLLRTWMAETIDDDIFTQFDTSPSTVLFGGDATSTATIDSGDKVTPSLFDKAVGKAKKASPKIWPVKVNGRDYFIILIHTDVTYDLRQNGTWQQSQREASPRDTQDNPIFSGMLGYHNGCILHEHEKTPISTTYGAGADQTGASNFFLGRQAGLFGWGSRAQWWEKEFDYGARPGFCVGAIWDFTKAVFNSVDHGFIALRTYRTSL